MFIDEKGLVSSNSFDAFFRTTASFISTNQYGPPVLWKSRSFYVQQGIISGYSSNYVHQQVNDAVDSANGFETYAYSDGLGRPIQAREEAETGQFRVSVTVYDNKGKTVFATLPFFGSGWGYSVLNGNYAGVLTEYEGLGRLYRVTPSVQGTFSSGRLQSTNFTSGDSGSPTAATTTTFTDGTNPWATVITDPEGKVKKSARDGYARAASVTEVTSGGNLQTTFSYDLLGNPTNITDSAGNVTRATFDSFGRKTTMDDPDMGHWSYQYDSASRLVSQTDARTNTLNFFYADSQGRMTSKQIVNSASQLLGTITYTYDVSDDPAFTVYKGQLYKITDLQGFERSSYDVRGRVLKTGRLLSANSIEYVTSVSYDDADRATTLTYPANSAVIKYSYDTGGNLSQVKSLAGTGSQEIFYTPLAFNELGQVVAYTNGNGVLTTNTFFANSKRVQRAQALKGGTNIQDLTYTYERASEVKSIADGVYTSAASGSVSTIGYDDQYRVTSVSSTARGLKNFGYDGIGNILTNQDFGAGRYSYGLKPHAVTNANGVSYSYDPCGNMTQRGSQVLRYNEQNELVSVTTGTNTVAFGYADDGERLWRLGTNGYSVWIGGLYEVNNGKVLCHVFAGGQRIATFEPQCGGVWSSVIGEEHWAALASASDKALCWPFQRGRAVWSFLFVVWAGVLLGLLRLKSSVNMPRRSSVRYAFKGVTLWHRAITFASISAFLGATCQTADAQSYNPIFYYYHSDHLGSSNIITDRVGNVVQHYEYSTFGHSTYTSSTSAFALSNRYTDQILDDETGLYYYGARYYDPQLGRFVQPDTEVQAPDCPQTLNRYSYSLNNPLNFTDPSGHDAVAVVTAIVIGMVVGGVIGGAVAAATGGDIGRGILCGAISGALVGAGIGLANFAVEVSCVEAGSLTAAGITAAGGAIGGAAGGAASAAVSGGDIGTGALIGAITGAVAGFLDGNELKATFSSRGAESGTQAAAHESSGTTTFFDWWDGVKSNLKDFKEHFEITPNQAAGGASATIAASTGVSAPSTFVSMIPVVGSVWESAHYFSNGHWAMGTLFAGMAVLDLTGVGEIGSLAVKGTLKVTVRLAEKDMVHIMQRHWFSSTAKGAGKFAVNTTGAELKNMISESIAKGTVRPNTLGRAGYILEHDLGRAIGTDLTGSATGRLRTVIRPNGSVRTAFPY